MGKLSPKGTLLMSLEARIHFTDAATDAQKGDIACTGAHRWQSPGISINSMPSCHTALHRYSPAWLRGWGSKSHLLMGSCRFWEGYWLCRNWNTTEWAFLATGLDGAAMGQTVWINPVISKEIHVSPAKGLLDEAGVCCQSSRALV